jgi:general stress protein YciG
MKLPTELRKYFAQIGRRGGKVTSKDKAEAARQNGRKGGRPRKPDR